MRLLEIEKKARDLGISDTWKYSKQDLIKLIQKKEGNLECFSTKTRSKCGQHICCWRVDCT
ncbi:MAG: SAP domain-containing protein [Candidatus Omnitrophota bacterium]|jgi:hypothetical protein